jgi:hypothetical protein
MKRRVFLLTMVSLVVLACLGPAQAQAPAQSTKNLEVLALIGAQMGESMKALTGYSFQRRTAVTINGEQENVTLVQVAFGPGGQPLITTLSSEPQKELRGGPFMRRIEENKIAEMKGEIDQVMQLANSYLMLNQDTLGQLGRIAQVWQNPDGSLIRVTASGFQQPGDQVTITCDGQTKRQTETQVTTSIFGGQMTILAHYQKLATGLNYNSQTMIYVPAKGIQIAINTFNYIKQ